jgi:hypothetical protein
MGELMGRAQVCSLVTDSRDPLLIIFFDKDYVCPETKKVLIRKDEWKEYKLRIVSHNNFPTAAGLASSASGYACFSELCRNRW